MDRIRGDMMEQAEIFEYVAQQLASKFEVPLEKIKPEANLFKDLGMDSIDALDMLGMLENALKIEMKESELKKLRTVQDVVVYIQQHLPTGS